MYFLMVCTHHGGSDIADLRDRLRPEHRDWVATGGGGLACVLTGSALWSAEGRVSGTSASLTPLTRRLRAPLPKAIPSCAAAWSGRSP